MINSELSLVLFAFSTDYCFDDGYLDYGMKLYRYLVQNSRNVQSINSLFDLLGAAENKIGGCMNLFTKVWDIAGSVLIIEEAEGVKSNLNGTGLKFEISLEILDKNFSVLAGGLMVYGQLSEVIRRILKSLIISFRFLSPNIKLDLLHSISHE